MILEVENWCSLTQLWTERRVRPQESDGKPDSAYRLSTGEDWWIGSSEVKRVAEAEEYI